jgi:hypothetical protein
MQPHYMKRTTRQISHGGPYSDDFASLVKKARPMEQFRAYAYAGTDNQI